MFKPVSLYLHEEDDIGAYSHIEWPHSIVQVRNGVYHWYCFVNGKINLVDMSTTQKDPCPFKWKTLNFLMPW